MHCAKSPNPPTLLVVKNHVDEFLLKQWRSVGEEGDAVHWLPSLDEVRQELFGSMIATFEKANKDLAANEKLDLDAVLHDENFFMSGAQLPRTMW